jgi:hypothetical protein
VHDSVKGERLSRAYAVYLHDTALPVVPNSTSSVTLTAGCSDILRLYHWQPARIHALNTMKLKFERMSWIHDALDTNYIKMVQQ